MASSEYVAAATDPSVSTGGVVVYLKANGDVAKNNLAGDNEEIVLSAADILALLPSVGFSGLYFFLPSVSHDGTLVCVHGQYIVGGPDDSDELWIMGIDGSNPTQLTNFDGLVNVTMRGSFSPDDSQIVFDRQDATHTITEIWRIDADGSNLTMIESFGTTVSATAPCWGFNDVIVFLKKDFTSGDPYEIWTMDPDGSGAAQLMTDLDLTDALVSQPTWSTDAVHIFVQLNLADALTLYKMDADGLNSTAVLADDPNWSTIFQGFAIVPPGTLFFIIAEEFSIFITIGPPRLPICRILYGLG